MLAHAPKLKGLGSLTAFSAVWAQCTKATIPIVPIVVPSNVNFEAVDIAIDSLAICQNGTALLETIFKVAASLGKISLIQIEVIAAVEARPIYNCEVIRCYFRPCQTSQRESPSRSRSKGVAAEAEHGWWC